MHPNHHMHMTKTNDVSLNAIRNRHLRILIVDDERRFRQSMSFNLRRKYDALVTDVSSGKEAVERIRSGASFDIIFLDLTMPEMSGTETYKELKKIDVHCSIVMMSAHSDNKEWANAKQLDVELLSKPIPADALKKIFLNVPSR